MISGIKKYVINLPSRSERLDRFYSNMRELGWDYEVIDGIEHDEPMMGISLAHRKVIQIANNLNMDYVCVMEDDVMFPNIRQTNEYIVKCLQSVPKDFDLILGGYYTGTKIGKYNQDWHMVGQFCGLHFYIASKKFYGHILNHDGKSHIDRYMNLQDDKKVYCTNKFFAMQYDGWSDNVKKVTDYNNDISHKLLL